MNFLFHTRHSPVAQAVILACAATAGAAQAQTLTEVVVSASRFEQQSFDAPASIQAVGRDTIASSGPQVNLSESMNRVPGISALNRQNYAQDLQLSIRGSGARSPFGIRGSRLIVDGIPATMPDGQGQASTVSLSSAERIEVLRGPLAQLYGNSAGGVVQVFTADGPARPEVRATGDVGANGLLRLGAQANDALQRVALVCGIAAHRLDQVRDQLVAAVQLDIDLTPRFLNEVALLDETVVRGQAPDADGDHDDEQKDEDELHGRHPSGRSSERPWAWTR